MYAQPRCDFREIFCFRRQRVYRSSAIWPPMRDCALPCWAACAGTTLSCIPTRPSSSTGNTSSKNKILTITHIEPKAFAAVSMLTQNSKKRTWVICDSREPNETSDAKTDGQAYNLKANVKYKFLSKSKYLIKNSNVLYKIKFYLYLKTFSLFI